MTTIYTMPNGAQILSASIPPAPAGLYETMKRRYHIDRLTTRAERAAFNTISRLNNRELDNRPIEITHAVASLNQIAADTQLPEWLHKRARQTRSWLAKRYTRRLEAQA